MNSCHNHVLNSEGVIVSPHIAALSSRVKHKALTLIKFAHNLHTNTHAHNQQKPLAQEAQLTTY